MRVSYGGISKLSLIVAPVDIPRKATAYCLHHPLISSYDSLFVVVRFLLTACASALALSYLCVSGCALSPKDERPAGTTPPAYKEAENFKVAQPRDAMQRGKWWDTFNDARLSQLMEQVDVSNQNVRLAEAQFRQARALVQQ